MKIYFVTKNENKQKEAGNHFDIINAKEKFNVELSFVNKSPQEILHHDIEAIVRVKAMEAYRMLGLPCVVEHGGIFIDSLKNLPGGIGHIIWNAVGDRMCSFLNDQDSRNATARSIIGYCDGKKIYTYAGETKGQITKLAKGEYKFNWDPIFIPDGYEKTYGEMGMNDKRDTSQVIKAWNSFLEGYKVLSAASASA